MWLYTFLLLACAAATLMAQAPVISFDKTHYDFGRITPDRKVAAKYRVTNTGNAYLSITQVRPSCGCTSTVLGKRSLAPGESTEVEANFDPHGFRGKVHKSIQVVSDDPAHGRSDPSLAARRDRPAPGARARRPRGRWAAGWP